MFLKHAKDLHKTGFPFLSSSQLGDEILLLLSEPTTSSLTWDSSFQKTKRQLQHLPEKSKFTRLNWKVKGRGISLSLCTVFASWGLPKTATETVGPEPLSLRPWAGEQWISAWDVLAVRPNYRILSLILQRVTLYWGPSTLDGPSHDLVECAIQSATCWGSNLYWGGQISSISHAWSD